MRLLIGRKHGGGNSPGACLGQFEAIHHRLNDGAERLAPMLFVNHASKGDHDNHIEQPNFWVGTGGNDKSSRTGGRKVALDENAHAGAWILKLHLHRRLSYNGCITVSKRHQLGLKLCLCGSVLLRFLFVFGLYCVDTHACQNHRQSAHQKRQENALPRSILGCPKMPSRGHFS